jgi:hypothetical protein
MSTTGERSTFSTAAGAERFVDAFNARDEEALRLVHHPDAILKRPTWPRDGGVEASIESIRLDFDAYPDGKLEIQQLVVQDHVAVVEFQFEGKNTAPLTLFSGRETLSMTSSA